MIYLGSLISNGYDDFIPFVQLLSQTNFGVNAVSMGPHNWLCHAKFCGMWCTCVGERLYLLVVSEFTWIVLINYSILCALVWIVIRSCVYWLFSLSLYDYYFIISCDVYAIYNVTLYDKIFSLENNSRIRSRVNRIAITITLVSNLSSL